MMIYGKVEWTDLYDVEALLYVQEAQLDNFCQELSIPSVTVNVAQAITNQNSGRNGRTSEFYQYSRGRGCFNHGQGRRR